MNSIYFWFKHILGFIYAIALCAGCETTSTDPPVPPYQYKMLALGDSYTIGESVQQRFRWPNQLRDSLFARGTQISEVTFIAQTGWTTGNLLAAMDTRDPEGPFDLVSLLIGVNNQYQNQPVYLFQTDFNELLDRAILLAGGRPERVIVLSIPDYGYTPFGQSQQANISPEIDLFNQAKQALVAARPGVRYFDITPISREGLNDLELIAADGLHPGERQYARWVKLIVPAVDSLLRN